MKTAEEFESWSTLIVKEAVLHILVTAFKTLQARFQFLKFKSHVVEKIAKI